MASNGSRLAIQVVLALVIVALTYVLYQSIRGPQVEYEALQRANAVGHERMNDVRNALISYRDATNTYPATLDSLVIFAKTDTSFAVPETEEPRLMEFNADSLRVSARNGEVFNYEVVRGADSTGAFDGVEIYWLQDPAAPGDSIGARTANPALRNAASWE